MTQEEKAKAYDKALERAREIHNEHKAQPFDVMIKVFPELAESEDEKIRKKLITFFQRFPYTNLYDDGLNTKDVLAWLEKQGNKDILENAVLDGNEDGLIAETIKYKNEKQGEQKPYGQREECRNCQFNYAGTCKGLCDMKIREQKPTDKPKFSRGQWVACKHLNTARIINIDDDKYEVEFIDGNKGFPHIDYVDRFFHLWTIQDAKDGDILAVERDKTPFIFKEFDRFHPECPVAYCGIDDSGIFVNSDDGWWTDEKCYPATKEQRDLLFQKMKEAGYEWDKQEKRPIKVPKTKEETGVLKQLIDEEKYTWSEEDDYLLNETIQHLEELIRIEKVKHCGIDVQYYQRDIDWLKSLKDRYTWKPSEEQLDALHDAAVYVDKSMFPYPKGILMKLYKQLKKLREK